jgi:hypothetical protein
LSVARYVDRVGVSSVEGLASVTAVPLSVGFAPDAGPRPSGPSSDQAPPEWAVTDRGSRAEPSEATVAVGPVGPAGSLEESFDRPPSPSLIWDEPLSGDRPGSQAPSGEGLSGVDLRPTNELLGQILDELRRLHQPAPIASGRSVYPER